MSFAKKIWHFSVKHKVLTFFILVVAVTGAYFFISGGAEVAQSAYQFGVVKRGELSVTVSGTGQVASENSLDIKSKVSGDIIYIPVVQGQSIGAGATIAQLDTTDAQKAVRDAESALTSAEISMTKLKTGSADIAQLREEAFANIANAFLDLPAIITGAQNVILSDEIRPRSQDNFSYFKDFVSSSNDIPYAQVKIFLDASRTDYDLARASYDKAFLLYKNTNGVDDAAGFDALLAQTIATTKSLSQALKSEQNLLDFLTDYAENFSRSLPSQVATYKTNLRTYIGQVNSHLSALSSAESNIANAPLDIQSQQLTLTQKQNALVDAKAELAKYYIRAPFSGIIASVPAKKGDSASASTILATLVTRGQLAEISFNEVDAAKIKVGQKAEITFDALPDLKLKGEVTSLDIVGSVSQGVVTYVAKISFSDASQSVKPGMSVSASIAIDSRENVLIVPSSAIKQKGDRSYVEIIASAANVDNLSASTSTRPRQQVLVGQATVTEKTVQIGLVSDTETEILSGLEEGERIIVGTRKLVTTGGAAPASILGGSGTRTGGGTNTGGFFRAASGR